MNMDYNLYKIFLYLYEEKSISKTASKLYVSQPAISYSLKELENSLGYTLFTRNSKGIEPTIEAKELYNYIRTAFNILNDAEEHINNLKDLTIGTIRIGVSSHIGALILSDYIKTFIEKYPHIKFDIITKTMNELVEMLETRKLDIIIGMSPINSEKNIKKINLKELYNCFAYNKKLLKDIKITKEKDLMKYPLILPDGSLPIRNKLDDYMEERNIRLEPNIEVYTTEVLLEMVRKGMGVGYFIQDTILSQPDKENFEIITFENLLPSTEISLVYIEEYTSIATKKFINSIRKS